MARTWTLLIALCALACGAHAYGMTHSYMYWLVTKCCGTVTRDAGLNAHSRCADFYSPSVLQCAALNSLHIGQ